MAGERESERAPETSNRDLTREGLEPSLSAEARADREAGAPARAPLEEPSRRGRLGEVLALFFLVVALFVITGPLLQKALGLGGVVVFQVVGVLGLPVLYLRWARLPIRVSIGLTWPSGRAVVGSAILGASLWYIPMSTLLPLQNLIMPPSDAFLAEREALFELSGSLEEWLSLLLFAAITPAICEEIFFRGVLLSGSRPRLGDWTAILLVSVLFSLFHLNPYQLSITFLLGAVMGWLRVRTGSILCSMAFHLCNNSVVLVLAQRGDETLPLWAAAPLLGGIVLGLELVTRTTGGTNRAADISSQR